MRPTDGRRVGGRLLAIGVLLAAGCGGPRQKATYPVRGRVVGAGNEPAAGALVTFHPVAADPADPARPTGTTDAGGNYALTTYSTGDGAPAGEYVITVVWPPPRRTPFEPAGGDRLGGKLASPDKTPHKYTVEARPDQDVPPITLP